MFERIMLCLDERDPGKPGVAQALRLAQSMDARLFVVTVLSPIASPVATDPAAATCKPPRRFRRRRTPDPASEREETAWCRLYEIEDDCFDLNVKSSLLLETGDRDERVLSLIESYQLDALAIGTRSVSGWEALIERCPVPVILLRQRETAAIT